jgi:hypothetical protein
VQVVELPQLSVARYVRVIVITQPFVTALSLTCVFAGFAVQLSDADTALVFTAGRSPMHCTVTGAGHDMFGGIVSCTVITCVQVVELPHASVARYVRVIVITQPFVCALSPTCVLDTTPQLSEADTAFVSAAGTSATHCTVTGEGHVMLGGIESWTVMVCVQVVELPHASVARYVRVIVMTQPFVTALSPTCVFAGFTVQLSDADTAFVFTAGTSPVHCTVTGAGHVIDGGVLSWTVIVWSQSVLFPQSSVARYVRVIVITQPFV